MLLIAYSLSLFGCAAGGHSTLSLKVSSSDYIDIESFCQKHSFKYNYDTIDDIIKIYSQDKEIKVLLNSFVGTLGRSIFYLKAPPVYSDGMILLPRQLENMIASKKKAYIKPLFKIKTIIVDPGHGGRDPGAVSKTGLKEKGINLRVARYLKKELSKQGFKVVLTRSKDIFLALGDRVNVARKHKADLFISIHTNSNHSTSIRGAEIYYLAPNRLNSRERSARLAKVDTFFGRNMPFNVEAILWDMLITKNYDFSIELSDVLYFTFKNLGFKVRQPKQAPFYVLRFAYVPSVLVEIGYLSNKYEEKTLKKKYYQRQIAEAIALSVTSLNTRYSNER